MKILTVAVVTLPFTFEAKRRMDNAVGGVEDLRKSVDSIIIIPNDKIREVVPKGTPFPEALKVAGRSSSSRHTRHSRTHC